MKHKWPSAFKNFLPEELACKQSGGYAFQLGFPEKLQALRDAYGHPIVSTSCCRSEEYNKSLPNSSDISLHIYDKKRRKGIGTCAIDVKITDSVLRHRFLKYALQLGWSCYFIGGNPMYIHCDMRTLLGEDAKFW